MDQGSLVAEQINAGERLAREFNKAIPLSAAFWLKEGDEGEWYFYLASDQINDSNLACAYDEVIRILRGGSTFWLDSMQVKVTGSDKPVAHEVIDIQRKYPNAFATRHRNRMLGNIYAADAVVYPIPLPTPVAG